MDITAQIKKNLIERIKDSKDISFLNALQTLFDSSEQALYNLSKEEEQSIEMGRIDIRDGKIHSNEAVMSEVKEWLKKNNMVYSC